MIYKVRGNLFEHVHEAYAQGVSNMGKMNSGIAEEFKEIFGNPMFQEYRNLCFTKKINPGDIHVYDNEDLPLLFNLITQDSLFCANKKFLCESMRKMYTYVKNCDISNIAMPRIGCGLGRLKFDDLIDSLDPFLKDNKIDVTIYHI